MNSTPPPTLPVRIDRTQLQQAVQLLRAVNHDLRYRILSLLQQQGPLTVTEIFIALRMEQSIASQHLAILRQADLVTSERDGKYIHYRVHTTRLTKLQSFLAQISPSDETDA